MRLDLLAKELESLNLGTTSGPAVDIFVHRMSEECAEGILLRNPLDGVPIDQNLPGYHKSGLQAIVRGKVQSAGDIKSKAVVHALTMYRRNFYENGNLAMEVKQLYPTKLPIVYMRSDGRTIEWSLNFHADYVLS